MTIRVVQADATLGQIDHVGREMECEYDRLGRLEQALLALPVHGAGRALAAESCRWARQKLEAGLMHHARLREQHLDTLRRAA